MPSVLSVSSSAVNETSTLKLGFVPVARSAFRAKTMLAMAPYMSDVPRPYIQPFSTVALNGLPCRQVPETGTTS